MTIRLRIISGEDENFYRDIEISGSETFLTLHNFIQQLLKFDEGQMASFFMTDEEWQKNEEITLMDMDENSETFIMSETTINHFIKDKKQRLLYLFDFFNDRNLFIEAYEINNNTSTETKCIGEQGEAPEQLDMSSILADSMGEPSQETDLGLSADELLGYSDSDFDDDPMISYTDDLEDF